MPFEHQHHAGAFTHAQSLEERGRAVAQLLELAEIEVPLLTFHVGPEQSLTFGFLFGPAVDHIIGKIEILRNRKPEIGGEVLIAGEIGPISETFYHNDCEIVNLKNLEHVWNLFNNTCSKDF